MSPSISEAVHESATQDPTSSDGVRALIYKKNTVLDKSMSRDM